MRVAQSTFGFWFGSLNFKILFQSAQESALLCITLTRMRFVLSHEGFSMGDAREVFFNFFFFSVCFIYDSSLPQPCHLKISEINVSQPVFRH